MTCEAEFLATNLHTTRCPPCHSASVAMYRYWIERGQPTSKKPEALQWSRWHRPRIYEDA